MSKLEWDKLKTFYWVAQLGSFAKASHHLNLSQSALSRQVAKLEYQVGRSLFNRSVKGVKLNDAGQQIYQLSKRILSDVEITEGKIVEDENEPSGNLKLSCTTSLASTWLVHYLTNFLEKHPKLSLSVVATDEEPDLSTCEVDIAIRSAMPERDDLIQEKLKSFQVKLFASKKYIEKFGTPKSLEDLANHRIITYGSTRNAPFDNIDWISTIGMPIGKIRPSCLRINSALGMYHAANEGLGIVPFCEGFENFATYKNSTLVPVLQEVTGPKADRFFIYSSKQKTSSKIQALLSHLKESVRRSEAEITARTRPKSQ